MNDTYNITVVCDTIEERDIVLEKVDELIPHGIVRYKTTGEGINNVFFSENNMLGRDKMREVN